MVKCLPMMQETPVRFLGGESPLEKEMATHSSTVAWKIPWMEEPGGLHTVHGVAKSRTRLSDFPFAFLDLSSNNLLEQEMLKILQARLQQYVNCELPDVQARF